MRDDAPQAARVVILSEGFWRREFDASPTIVGRVVTLNDRGFTVIGVMPRDFEYPPGADLWTPVRPELSAFAPTPSLLRDVNVLLVIGRLRHHVTLHQGRTELTTIIRRLAETYHRQERLDARGVSLADDLFGSARLAMWVLFAAVLLLLLIAVVNVSSLMLMRFARRRREFAVRLALGASPAALNRGLLLECVLLTVSAVAGAAALFTFLLPVLVQVLPADTPRVVDAHFDGSVAAFTFTAAAIVCGACWALTVWRLRDDSLDTALRSASSMVPSDRAYQRRLIAVEVATAVVLLACAGLLLRSARNMAHADLGFDARRLLVTSVMPQATLATRSATPLTRA